MLLATLCDRHAALWQLLKQWLSEDTPVRQQACRTAFVEQITRHDETVAARAASLNAGDAASGGRARARRRRGEADAGLRAVYSATARR